MAYDQNMLLQPLDPNIEYHNIDPEYELRKLIGGRVPASVTPSNYDTNFDFVNSNEGAPVQPTFEQLAAPPQQAPVEESGILDRIQNFIFGARNGTQQTPKGIMSNRSIASAPKANNGPAPITSESSLEIVSYPIETGAPSKATIKTKGTGGNAKNPSKEETQAVSTISNRYDQFLGEIDRQTSKEVYNHQDMIDTLGQYQRAYLDTTKPMLDLTPIASLVDSMTGSNFSKTYKAPENIMDRVKTVQALQVALDAKKNQQTDAAIKAQQLRLKVELEKEKMLATNANIAAQRGVDMQKVMQGQAELDLKDRALQAKLNKDKEAKDLPVTANEKLVDRQQLWKQMDALERLAAAKPILFNSLAQKMPMTARFVQKWTPAVLKEKFGNNAEELEMARVIADTGRLYGKTREGGVLKQTDEKFWDEVFGNPSMRPEDFIRRMRALKWQTFQAQNDYIRSYIGSYKVAPNLKDYLKVMAQADYTTIIPGVPNVGEVNAYMIYAKTPEEAERLKKDPSQKGYYYLVKKTNGPQAQQPSNSNAALLELIKRNKK